MTKRLSTVRTPKARPTNGATSQLALSLKPAADCYLTAHPGDSDKILQEIHHRVRNNLQLVLSLLNMQLQSVSSNDARSALAGSIRRIRTLSKAQDLFFHDDISVRFELGAQLRKFFEHSRSALLTNFEGQCPMTIDAQGQQVLMSAEEAIPCCLALSELATLAGTCSANDPDTNPLRVTVQGSRTEFAIIVSGRPLEALRGLSTEELLEMKLAKGFATQCGATLVLHTAGEVHISIRGEKKDFLGGD